MAIQNIVGFVYDWYGQAFYFLFGQAFRLIRSFEQTIALRVTVRYWFQPLYQDYTLIGYILGLPFRTLRIFIGVFLYLVILAGIALIYIVWAALLPVLIYKALWM